MDGLNVRSVRRKLRTRSIDCLEHRLHDKSATLLSLSQSTGQNINRKTLGLVVHLECSDAMLRTANFKVHVAKEVFKTLNVGEDDDVIAFLDKTHCNASDGSLDRHASIHQSEGRATGRSHGRRTVGFHDLGNYANSVRKFFLIRENRQERALSQGTMTDFTTLRCTHTTNLASAVRREVVLMHITLTLCRIDGIEALPFVEHAKRRNRESLGLTTLEKTRTVNTREIASLNVQRTNFGARTTVSTLARFNNHLTHCMLFE